MRRVLKFFLSVYRITPNPNTNAGLSPAELMFALKIRSVFDRILPSTTKTTATRENLSARFYKPGDKILFLNYGIGKSFWEGIILKRIGHMLYSVKRSKFDCRRHINQLRPRHTDDYCRNFGKELVILFHRTAAALWDHVASIIKKSSTGDSLSFGSTPTTVSIRSIVAALDGIRILLPSTTRDPRATNARAEFKGTEHTQS